jgi:hypothetical protein
MLLGTLPRMANLEESRAQPLGARSLSMRLCDAAVLGFAVWTLLCHLVVALGGSLRALLLASSIALGIGLVLAVWRLRARSEDRPGSDPTEQEPAPTLRLPLSLAALPAAVLTLAALLGLPPIALWWLGVLSLLVFLPLVWRGPAPLVPARSSRAWEGALWGLAVLIALVTLFAHQYSPDDAFYVNVAVAAVDSPSAPLLAHDTIHGVPDLPIMYAAYKAHSFELFAAMLAWLSGRQAHELCFWVLPPLLALLAVFANARLMRRLTPRIWLATLCASLGVLLFVGETIQFHGEFAFFRIHQGKAAFLTLVVPLILVYGLEHAAAPTTRSWLRLAAAQIAGVGLTSTALWTAPAVAGLTLLAALRFTRRGARAFASGLLASGYVLVVALILRSLSLQEIEYAPYLPGRVPLPEDGGNMLSTVWSMVFGNGAVSLACLFTLLGSWCFCRQRIAQRVALVFPLGLLLLLFNPYTGSWIARNATGIPIYWRVFWVVPLASLLGIVLTSPLLLPERRFRPSLRLALALVLTVGFLALAPQVRFTGRDLSAGLPWLEVPKSGFHIARVIVETAPPGSYVLAPAGISIWIPTFQRHPYPLVSRKHYLNIQRHRLGEAEYERRMDLHDYISGRREFDHGQDLLARGIEAYQLSCVAFYRAAEWSDEIREALLAAAFEQVSVEDHRRRGECEIWAR